MSKSMKLVLDLVMGAVVPWAILKYGTAPLGTLPAYLLAALVPVVYVLLDLLVITRRFNFITTYAGLSAIMRGALAFWYVDGATFALKDSASYFLAVLVFGGSYFLAKPVTRFIAMQGLTPETAAHERALDELLSERPVVHALRQSTLIIAFTNLLCGAANYLLNLRMVTAPFNTPDFNSQVADVNALTRFVLVIPDMIALFFAFSLMYKAMYSLLPAHTPGAKDEDFWQLVEQRETLLAAGHAAARDEAATALANRQAREEFGLPR
ncbi:MAG TPA: VC0807 family protein [Gemmatimonas sp.]|nr:VC0807 family protein [Gemmatimonas sp.]